MHKEVKSDRIIANISSKIRQERHGDIMAIRSNSITGNGGGGIMTGTGIMTGHQGALSSIGVSEGQVLKGVVTDVRGNQVTLEMNDGSKFTGQLSDASRYSIGQEAAFQVTSTAGRTIYLKAISDAYMLDSDDTVLKALEEAGLPKSSRNVDVVRALLTNQLSISKESIADALRLCAGFPEINVNAVITMNHLNYPMTLENLTQFEQYQNQTHQLMPKLEQLAESVTHVMDLIGNHAPKAAKAIGTELFSLLPEFISPETNAPSSFTMTIHTAFPDGSSLPEGQLLINGTPVQAQIIDGELVFAESEPLANELTTLLQKNPELLQKALTSIDTPVTFEANLLGSRFTPEQRLHLLNDLQNFPLSFQTKAAIQDGTITVPSLLENIKSAFSNADTTSVAAILSSKDIQSLIQSELIANWSITPRFFRQKENLDQLYKRIEEQTKTLSRFSEEIFQKNALGELGNVAKGLQQNLDFMKLLNENLAYLQLPLKLKEENAHGDLYVMTRKDALKKHPEKLRVLLHLELDHLGQLDIHLEKEYSSISAKFYVETQKIQRLFDRNLNLLSDALGEQGYYLSAETALQEKQVDIVKDFIAQDIPIGDMKRYNFDLRA